MLLGEIIFGIFAVFFFAELLWSLHFLIQTRRTRNGIKQDSVLFTSATLGLIVLSVILLLETFFNLTLALATTLGEGDTLMTMARVYPLAQHCIPLLLVTVWRYGESLIVESKSNRLYWSSSFESDEGMQEIFIEHGKRQPHTWKYLCHAVVWILSLLLFGFGIQTYVQHFDDLEVKDIEGGSFYYAGTNTSALEVLPAMITMFLTMFFSIFLILYSAVKMPKSSSLPARKYYITMGVMLLICSLIAAVGNGNTVYYPIFTGNGTLVIYLFAFEVCEQLLLKLH